MIDALMKKMKTWILLLIMICAGCAAGTGKYYAIDHFYFEEEGDSFREAFAKTTVDVYDWYKSIEDEDGVYILHSEYYADDLLDQWREFNVYANVPEKGFWYFVVSENYLRDRGYEIAEEDRQAIQSGIRLYLLPDTLSKEQLESMKGFLHEDALHGLITDTLIKTTFEHDRNIAFKTYHFEGTLETSQDGEISHPVIFVCSSENMRYFESESLIATGKNDSYIKLSVEAYEKYAKENLPIELKRRKITFMPLDKINN